MPTTSDLHAPDTLDLAWSDWCSLDPADGAISAASTDEGLYRVRHPEYDGLVYVGETGRSTHGRIYSLARGTFAAEMPYRDPHTAAPTLWAIRDQDGPALEISWTTPAAAADKQVRKSLEAALIAVHRRDLGHSPTANFGRIIDGYRQSSYRKGGQRGGPLPDGETEANAAPGVGPLPWTQAATPVAPDWMGLDWAEPRPLADASQRIPTADGLYRIWDTDKAPPLEYIGQSSNLKSRLYRHRRNRDVELLFSYAPLPNHDALHKRVEVETDLIGAHWLMVGESPYGQF